MSPKDPTLVYYTNMLKDIKYIQGKKKISLAMVTSKTNNSISAHNPKLNKNIEIKKDLFGNKGTDSLFYSCNVGDIIEYDPKSSINSIVRNLTNEHRMQAFQTAYDSVYAR